jgi:hypothetical protein
MATSFFLYSKKVIPVPFIWFIGKEWSECQMCILYQTLAIVCQNVIMTKKGTGITFFEYKKNEVAMLIIYLYASLSELFMV